MRLDRHRGRPVRHLAWRVRLMGAGAVLGLTGIYFDSSWLLNAAIGVLVVGFALRFVPSAGEPADDEGGDAGGAEGVEGGGAHP